MNKNVIAENNKINTGKRGEESKRNPAFDLLRVLSIVGVIVMHVTAAVIGDKFELRADYLVNLIINAPFHYGVPIFVMISGALFLNPNKQINIRKLWLHNIFRIVIAYFVWSTAYGIYDYMQYKAGWKFIIWEIVNSRDHLWFLPMIVGIYIIVPIINTWIQNAKKSEIKYFITLFIIFQIICETIKALPTPEIALFILELRRIQLVCSYVGYFVLGFYIIHIGLKKIMLKLLYILGIVGGLLSIASVIGISYIKGIPSFEIVDSFSLLTFFWSAFIFVAVCRLFDKNSCICEEEISAESTIKNNRRYVFLSELGKDTFGTYLCHIFVFEILANTGIDFENMPKGLGIVVLVLLVYVIGNIVSAVLRRLPFIGKYIC